MEYKKFYIKGKVINAETEEGLYNYRVEAWDKDQVYHDLVGVCQTDRVGLFEMVFDHSYFREHYPEKAPDLFFRVFKSKKLVKSTEDDVIWDAKERTSVTIPLEIEDIVREGKDRIKTEQVFNLVGFFKKSDFSGTYNETKAKTFRNVAYVKDMFANSFSTMDFNPIQVKSTPNDLVFNQDVNAAVSNLEADQIEVQEVREYNPRLNISSLKDLSTKPFDLKQGEKVILYQENGKVKYYSLVKPARTNKDMLREFEVQRKEIKKLQDEVESSKGEVVKKDKQINELTKSLESLQKEQNDIKEILLQIPTINTDTFKDKETKKPIQKGSTRNKTGGGSATKQ